VGGEGRARVAEIERWAYRMFRLPTRVRGFLPILPSRAESLLAAAEAASSGGGLGTDEGADPTEPRRRTRLLVEAETFEEVREAPGRPGGATISTGPLP
jgi:hypothetical protein